MAETVSAPTYALIADANTQTGTLQTNLNAALNILAKTRKLHPNDIKAFRTQVLGQLVTAKTATQAALDAVVSA